MVKLFLFMKVMVLIAAISCFVLAFVAFTNDESWLKLAAFGVMGLALYWYMAIASRQNST